LNFAPEIFQIKQNFHTQIHFFALKSQNQHFSEKMGFSFKNWDFLRIFGYWRQRFWVRVLKKPGNPDIEVRAPALKTSILSGL